MGFPKTQPAVLDALIKNAGKPVSLNDLKRATGFHEGQIQAAIRNLIAADQPIKIVMKAQVWQYNGTPEPETEPENGPASGDVWEVIGRSKNGKIILRDGTGLLFVAEPMDV